MIRLGYVLQDTFLINKATAMLNYVASQQDARGYLGWGKGGHTEATWSIGGTTPHWCINVLSRAFLAWYSATKNSSMISMINKAYQNMIFSSYSDRRETNVEAMLEFYTYGGASFLKDNAFAQLQVLEPFMLNQFINGIDLVFTDPSIPKSTCISSSHGVTYNENAKLFAIGYPFAERRNLLFRFGKAV